MSFGVRLRKLRADVNAAIQIENSLGGKMQKPKSSVDPTPLSELLHASVDACKAERKRKREADGEGPVGDEEILKLARHTRNYALAPYRQFLWYVPRLVNVVSLAEAVPAEGSGVTLPLDLRKIASRCRGAFYAPARFAAVQLAFSQPRSRILIFHTGRLVGTGTTGSIAARVAITRAQRQLAVEAGIYLNIQSFQVINTVGAVSLRASLNCDAFATAHSSDAHYDRASFVGLAWRPPRESLCCGARLLPLPLPRVCVPLSARTACVQKYTALGEGTYPALWPSVNSSTASPVCCRSCSASPRHTHSSQRSQKTCSGRIAPTQTQPRKRRVWWSTRQRVAPLRVPTNRSKWSWIKSQKTCGPVGVEA